ncbi:MAG: peptide chain release factor N(5)-glutamine methyltransferase, partial [Gammaproteobacteria bacterium]|nr:peptide chain release factor N(5)-glutamine methyltransferase [Gammaproteobacteria bacterium]
MNLDPVSLHQALTTAAAQLGPTGDSSRLEADLLLAHTLDRPRLHLYAQSEQILEPEQLHQFRNLVERRSAGEPIAHLLGRREFWSLELRISPDTLIPRPETERLVEQALTLIPPDSAWEIADLGTGSGAIALAIASERPRCRLVATDISAPALEMARSNAKQLNLGNISFLRGDWYAPLGNRRFRMILSNPPYIPATDPHLKQGDLRFEPSLALESGTDGLSAIRAISTTAREHLTAPGFLMLEHGF